MKLLLDTHILLWSILEPGKLSKKVFSELNSAKNEFWLSPITTWEILILAKKNRINLKTAKPSQGIKKVYSKIPFKEAAINHEIAIKSQDVELPHNDPADRFLVSTAIIHNLTLVTADQYLIDSQQVKTLAN